MKIKNSLRIDGENWKVIKNKKGMSEDGSYGSTNYPRREIMVDPGAKGHKVTMLHEAIHIVSNNAILELEERQVTRLAHGIYAFIRDNKIDFNEDDA